MSSYDNIDPELGMSLPGGVTPNCQLAPNSIAPEHLHQMMSLFFQQMPGGNGFAGIGTTTGACVLFFISQSPI
jgi:hypothetical protein